MMASSFGVFVFPNPAKEILNIAIKNINPLGIYLYDLNGKRVYFSSSFGGDNSGVKEVDVSMLVSGVYLLKITTTESQFFRKVAINNP